MIYRLVCDDDPIAAVMKGENGYVLLQIDETGVYSCRWPEDVGDPSALNQEIVRRARRHSRLVCSLDHDEMRTTLGAKAADMFTLTGEAIAEFYPKSVIDIEATTSSVSS